MRNITHVSVLLRNYVSEREPEAIRAQGGDHIRVSGLDRRNQNGEVRTRKPGGLKLAMTLILYQFLLAQIRRYNVPNYIKLPNSSSRQPTFTIFSLPYGGTLMITEIDFSSGMVSPSLSLLYSCGETATCTSRVVFDVVVNFKVL